MLDESFETIARTMRLGKEVTRARETTLVDPDGTTHGPAELGPLVELRVSDDLTSELRVLGPLGEGGMGLVRLAAQSSLSREVALKTVRPGSVSEARQAELLREARVLAVLDHPNVVPVHAVGTVEDGSIAVVMKRVEGQTWGDLIARRADPSDELDEHIGILIDVCHAVSYAHSKGILHRDLKPANVMIGAFGEVYVMDWGLAIGLPDAGPDFLPSIATVRRVVGTPSFIAPEMVLASDGVELLGPATDVYLLGGILHQILAGRPPHEGATTTEKLEAAWRSPPPKFAEGTSTELASICRRALNRDPELRFDSVPELIRALQGALRHLESDRMVREAEDRRERLSARLEDLDEQHVFGELGAIRFAFERALEAWPTNEAAERNLRDTIELSVRIELMRDNPIAAADLLEELDDPPRQLRRDVELALQRHAEQEEKARSFERLRASEDLYRGHGSRRLIAVVILVGLAGPGLLLPFVDFATMRAAYLTHIVGFGLIFGGAVWATRDAVLAPGVNRRQTTLLAIVYFAVVALRLLVLAGFDIGQLVVFEMLFYAAFMAFAGFTTDRTVAWGVPGYALGTLLATLLPEYAGPIYSVSHLVALTPVIVLPSRPPIGSTLQQ